MAYNREKIVKVTSGLEVNMLMKNNDLGPIFGQLNSLAKSTFLTFRNVKLLHYLDKTLKRKYDMGK